ncbi:hypothetical protein LOD99_4754 [Oopsacas minuta]|uniref:Uncharacterized protein n=1 Tax=Oopsacas minuta TaxID=111878 RepID=A0AAV7JU03_9METZ|nr:hypothetical protein LOD99_4754 [Oopsacas minuta]
MELAQSLDGLNSTSPKFLQRETLCKLFPHYGDVFDVNEALVDAELANYRIIVNSRSGIVTMDPAFYTSQINSLINDYLTCITSRCREKFLNYETSQNATKKPS